MMLFITLGALALSQNEILFKEKRPTITLLTECDGHARCQADVDTVTIANTVFENIQNTEDTEGGSVSLTFCVFTCTNTRFISCSAASKNGGAIYYFNQKESGKKSTISNCFFSKCHAGQNGGAIYFTQSKHETNDFLNCVFESNTVDGTGSCLYLVSQSGLISNCTFSNKEASNKGPLLVIQNTCQSGFAWANQITKCYFLYQVDQTTTASAISFIGTENLKPIEISSTCFMVDSSSTPSSSLKYIDSKTPVTFLESNVFSISEDQSISGSKINYNSTVAYDKNECSFSPINPPSSGPTSAPSSAPTSAPSSAPTSAPSSVPTSAPSSVPTSAPSSAPTSAPSSAPTSAPSSAPTSAPSSVPSSPTTNTNNFNKDSKEAADKEYKNTFKNFIIIICVCVAVFIIIVLTLTIVLIYVKLKYPSENKKREARSETSRNGYLKDNQLAENLF